jgi:hypothetical protein
MGTTIGVFNAEKMANLKPLGISKQKIKLSSHGGIMKMQIRSKKQQRIAAELGEIITEMGQAMWAANRARIDYDHPMTPHMSDVLAKFHDYCARNPK